MSLENPRLQQAIETGGEHPGAVGVPVIDVEVGAMVVSVVRNEQLRRRRLQQALVGATIMGALTTVEDLPVTEGEA